MVAPFSTKPARPSATLAKRSLPETSADSGKRAADVVIGNLNRRIAPRSAKYRIQIESFARGFPVGNNRL
jgi:hypothetical protein